MQGTRIKTDEVPSQIRAGFLRTFYGAFGVDGHVRSGLRDRGLSYGYGCG